MSNILTLLNIYCMLFIFSISAMFTTNCNKEINFVNDHIIVVEKMTPYINGVHPEIQPYYETFSDIYGVNVDHIPANFINIEQERIAGLCMEYSNGFREILIDLDSWNTLNETVREILIVHELGHCFFDRKHSKEFMNTDTYGNIPKSIMFPVLIYDIWYLSYKQFYLLELENGTKQHSVGKQK